MKEEELTKLNEEELTKLIELKEKVKSFFDDYLDYTEIQGPEEKINHPIHVSCSRAVMIPKLSKLLDDMKRLSR